jgi:hypothetical protein
MLGDLPLARAGRRLCPKGNTTCKATRSLAARWRSALPIRERTGDGEMKSPPSTLRLDACVFSAAVAGPSEGYSPDLNRRVGALPAVAAGVPPIVVQSLRLAVGQVQAAGWPM